MQSSFSAERNYYVYTRNVWVRVSRSKIPEQKNDDARESACHESAFWVAIYLPETETAIISLALVRPDSQVTLSNSVNKWGNSVFISAIALILAYFSACKVTITTPWFRWKLIWKRAHTDLCRSIVAIIVRNDVCTARCIERSIRRWNRFRVRRARLAANVMTYI